MPPLYIAYALRGGLAVLFVASALLGRALDTESAKAVELWMALSTAILMLFYLDVMASARVTTAESIRHLVRGLASLVGDFYIKYCVARAGIYMPVTIRFPGRAR